MGSRGNVADAGKTKLLDRGFQQFTFRVARHPSTMAVRRPEPQVDWEFVHLMYTPRRSRQLKEVHMGALNALHVLLVIAVLCGLVQSAAGQSSATAGGQSSAKAEVLAALAERDKAFVAGDETKVAQFMSEDYLQTDVSGNVEDKQDWLNEYYRPLAPLLKSGKTQLPTFNRSEMVVRELGDTVVVAGKGTLKFLGANPWNSNATYSPGPPLAYRFTHVWIERGGAWKLAVIHNAIPAERK